MKLLIWSDAGAHTGYGTVTQNLAERWAKRGADIHVLATNYLGDPWPGPMKLYPATKVDRGDVFGFRRLAELLNRLKPDVFFVLHDLYVVADGLKTLQGKFPVPTVLYVPVDGMYLPHEWLNAARAAHRVVAMSKYGQTRLKIEGDIQAEMLWHGVEHQLLYQVSAKRPIYFQQGSERRVLTNKEECKQALGLTGRFVIAAVNRNSIRKNYYDTFRIFDRFRRVHPEAFLFIHAVQRDEGGDLGVLAQRYGLTAEHLRIHNAGDTYTGVGKEWLTLLYNAADVKLSTSMAEGFGLTDAESLACGTPVIAQDFSATSEVVGPGGILVPPARHFTTARMVDFALPDVDKMYDALEHLYQDSKLRRELAEKAIAHAQHFNWDVTAQGFWEIFKEIQEPTIMALNASNR